MRRARDAVVAGDMRHYIVVQQPTVSTTSLGDYTETHSNVLTVPAAIEPVEGSEPTEANAVIGFVTHKITIRWCVELSALAPNWRLLLSRYDSPETYREFDVVRVLNVMSFNRYIEMMCRERV